MMASRASGATVDPGGSALVPCEFVTFHDDFDMEGVAHPHANVESAFYHTLLDCFFRSARLFHPGAELCLLTTAATRLSGMKSRFRRVDVEATQQTAMLARAEAQLRYAERSRLSRPLIFADADMLVNGSLDALFEQDFDVALTYRWNKTMPINGGLIVLNSARPARGVAFMQEFYRTYRAKYARDAKWYGDQMALHDCISLTYAEILQLGECPVVTRNDCRFLLLPCDIYNHSPEDSFASIREPDTTARILHFKGDRKRLMLRYWQAYLQFKAQPGLRSAYEALIARAAIRWLARERDRTDMHAKSETKS